MVASPRQEMESEGGGPEAKRRRPSTAELSDVLGEPALRGAPLGLSDVFPLLDVVAGRCAAVHAGGSVVTGCFDRVLTHNVGRHGDVVVAVASVISVGARSILMRVDAFAEMRSLIRNGTGLPDRIPLVSALATFVADASLVPLDTPLDAPHELHTRAPRDDDVAFLEETEYTQLMSIFKIQRKMVRGGGTSQLEGFTYVRNLLAEIRKANEDAQQVIWMGRTLLRIRRQFLPRNLNFAGKVFGGDILTMLDRAAVACAARVLNGPCVTRRVHTLAFWEPVEAQIALQVEALVVAVRKAVVCVSVRAVLDHRHDGMDLTPSHAGIFLIVPLLKNDASPAEGISGIGVAVPDSTDDEFSTEFYRALAVCSPDDFFDEPLKM